MEGSISDQNDTTVVTSVSSETRPVLDIRTQLGRRVSDQGKYAEISEVGAEGASRWLVTVWPTCREGSITWGVGTSTKDPKARPSAGGKRVDDDAQRSARRARQALRRYCRHNELFQFITLTFGGEVPAFDLLGEIVNNFWRRFTRATGHERGPWAMVPEFGSETGWLHLHMAVSWWDELNCSEVCFKCARKALLSIRDDVPQIGETTCVGCIWGHGFVGKPKVNGDVGDSTESLSGYLSKYLDKDFGWSNGRQRYRVGQGYEPTSIQVECVSPREALESLRVLAGTDDVKVVAESKEWSGWRGPPVWCVDWSTTR